MSMRGGSNCAQWPLETRCAPGRNAPSPSHTGQDTGTMATASTSNALVRIHRIERRSGAHQATCNTGSGTVGKKYASEGVNSRQRVQDLLPHGVVRESHLQQRTRPPVLRPEITISGRSAMCFAPSCVATRGCRASAARRGSSSLGGFPGITRAASLAELAG